MCVFLLGVLNIAFALLGLGQSVCASACGIFACVCVECTLPCTCMKARRQHWGLLYHPLSYSLKQNLSVNLDPGLCPANIRLLLVSSPTIVVASTHTAMSNSLHGCWSLNSCPRTYAATLYPQSCLHRCWDEDF